MNRVKIYLLRLYFIIILKQQPLIKQKNHVRLCHFQLSQRKERQNSGWFAWFKGRYKNEGNSVSRLGFFFSQVGFQLSLWSLILILCLVYGYIISINLNQRMSYCRWGSGQATPYMAVWHIEYLKLKEFGKWHVQVINDMSLLLWRIPLNFSISEMGISNLEY